MIYDTDEDNHVGVMHSAQTTVGNLVDILLVFFKWLYGFPFCISGSSQIISLRILNCVHIKMYEWLPFFPSILLLLNCCRGRRDCDL